jgi:hypothetical protein
VFAAGVMLTTVKPALSPPSASLENPMMRARTSERCTSRESGNLSRKATFVFGELRLLRRESAYLFKD